MMQKLIALCINCICTMKLVTAFKMVEEHLSPNYKRYLFENMDTVFKTVRALNSSFNSFQKDTFISSKSTHATKLPSQITGFLLRLI